MGGPLCGWHAVRFQVINVLEELPFGTAPDVEGDTEDLWKAPTDTLGCPNTFSRTAVFIARTFRTVSLMGVSRQALPA